MSRPMTSRQAHRAYLDKSRRPRFSRAEERRMEREEQEKIREEQRAAQAQERARAARERARAREEEERRERRRRGEPAVAVSASQGVISGFFRRGGGGVERGGRGGHETARNGGELVSKSGDGAGDENARNTGGLFEGPSERVGDGNKGSVGSVSANPGGREGGENTGNAQGPVSNAPCGGTANGTGRNPELSVVEIAKDRLRDCAPGNSNRSEVSGVRGAGQDDATELDDLFLSASQLVREVESMPPPPPRKRVRDEAFPAPESSPTKPANPTAVPAADTSFDEYDLGISSQELLQLEVQAAVPEEHTDQQPPRPEAPAEPPEPPEPPADAAISSTQQSFELCSQELLEIDALIAGVRPQTKHPVTDTCTSPRRNEHDTARTKPERTLAHETREPQRVTTRANPAATEKDAPEPPEEDAEEPQPFFTSCTQELISLAEKRSRATATAEARMRRCAAALPDAGGGSGAGGSSAVGATSVGKDGQAGRERKCEAGGRPPEARRPGVDLDDDAWWEDLDDTELEALLAS